MKNENNKKLEFWRNHVIGAESHPDGTSTYLREHGLKSPTYFTWRKKLKKIDSHATILPSSPFLPVVVGNNKKPNIINSKNKLNENLPDPKWVAEVMLHLVRDL